MNNIYKSFQKNTSKPAFTIIEVIIVLVIGAVIMLAVFIVVPVLQRSQRNTRQQDNAKRILSAVQQYVNNNQNSYPSDGTAVLAITGTLTNPVGPVALQNSDFNYSGTIGTSITPSPGKVYIFKLAKCSGSNNTVANTTGFAVIIGLEPSNALCIESP